MLRTDLRSQQLQRPPFTGLNAYTAKHANVFSLNKNQAAMGELTETQIAVLAERRFLLNELSNYHCFLAIPTSSGGFGLKGSFAGFNSFSESELGLSYARKLG